MILKQLFTVSLLWLLLFSTQIKAEGSLPVDVIEEIQAAVDLQPGEIVYVDFWASWCKPCRQSFPWMNSIQQKYKSQGLKVLAVNVDNDRKLAAKFLKAVPSNFPILYDKDGRLASIFDLQAMPSSFVLDDIGQIIQSHLGFLEAQIPTYEQDLQSVLETLVQQNQKAN